MSGLQNWASFLSREKPISRKKTSSTQSQPFHSHCPPGRATITAVHRNSHPFRCARGFSSILTMYSSYLCVGLPSNQKPKIQKQTHMWDRPDHTPLTQLPRIPLLQHPSKSGRFLYPTPYIVYSTSYKVLTSTPKFLLKLTKRILYTRFYWTNGQESWKTKEDWHKEVAEMAKTRRQGQWPQRAKGRKITRQWNLVDSTAFGKARRKFLNQEIFSLQGKT